MFRKLLENNLYCKRSKCQFFADEVEFLGYEIKKGGMAIATDKIEAIVNYPVPKNKRDIRSFLGLANFSRRFIANFSGLVSPLTELTKDAN